MKKFMLSFAVLAITSLGFAQTSVEAVMRQQQEAASTRTEKRLHKRQPQSICHC